MDVRSKVLKRRNETLPVPPKGLNRASGWMGASPYCKRNGQDISKMWTCQGKLPLCPPVRPQPFDGQGLQCYPLLCLPSTTSPQPNRYSKREPILQGEKLRYRHR